MDFLGPTAIVFLVLAFVLVAALKFEPSQYPGKWQVLVDWFGSNSEPVSITHPDQPIEVSGAMLCDATAEVDGIWITRRAPESTELLLSLFIPWVHFRLHRQTDQATVFQLKKDASIKKVVTMTVARELGDAMIRRIPNRET